MMTDLDKVWKAVLDRDGKDLAVPDLANGLNEIDDRLLEPEVLQAGLFPRTLRAAHLARLDDVGRGIEDWRTSAHLQMFDPPKVDVLQQLDKAAFWV